MLTCPDCDGRGYLVEEATKCVFCSGTGYCFVEEAPKCDLCGGDLDIKATMIGCKSCGAIWGRCNGAWVEVKPDEQ